MSAFPPEADICQRIEHVCFVPIADIVQSRGFLLAKVARCGMSRQDLRPVWSGDCVVGDNESPDRKRS
jgi:hypothetical protein